jgi:hypothetical protein
MTIFVVQAPGEDDRSLLRATFIKDGFSWAAFAFGPFWLLYRRLWLLFALWVVVEAAVIAFVVPHLSGGTALVIDLLAHVFIGFEGNRLRQGKAARRAVVSDLVEARGRDEAEVLFYCRQRPESAV